MIVYLGDNLMMLIMQFLLCTLFKVVISAREWESTKMFSTIMSQFIKKFKLHSIWPENAFYNCFNKSLNHKISSMWETLDLIKVGSYNSWLTIQSLANIYNEYIECNDTRPTSSWDVYFADTESISNSRAVLANNFE